MPGAGLGATVQACMGRNLIRSFILGVTALALAACGDADIRREAAIDVHGFMTAAHTSDRKAFRAHIDRSAVRADLRRQLQDQQPGATFDDGAIDRMVEPDAFSIQGITGLGLSGVPGPDRIALMLRVETDGRVCVVQPAIPPPCVLTFAKQGARWKLVAIDARDIEIVRTRAR